MAKPTTTPAGPFDLHAAAREARRIRREQEEQIAAEQARESAAALRRYIERASAFWVDHLGADFLAALGEPIRPLDADDDDRHLAFRVGWHTLILIWANHAEACIQAEHGRTYVLYVDLPTALLELIGEWLEEEDELGQVNAGMKDLLHSDEPERYFWLEGDAGDYALFANYGNIARLLAGIEDVERWLNQYIAPIITAAEEVQLANIQDLDRLRNELAAQLNRLNAQ